MRTLIVLPTYQEAANIPRVLHRIRAVLPEVSVLVVDDASPDGTGAMAEAVGQQVGGIDVLHRPAKAGLGSAYRDGFSWGLARGYDILIEMDADLSHDPATLPVLVRATEAGADLALGSRYVAGGTIPSWPWHRRALSRWGNRYAAWALGLPVADATSGFRAYRADVVAAVDLETVLANGYGFQIEMVYRVATMAGTIVEVPIRFTDRTSGSSKMSARILVEAMVLVTWWGAKRRTRIWREREPRPLLHPPSHGPELLVPSDD
jgi:dolichol-phosphate mannosyltransferase